MQRNAPADSLCHSCVRRFFHERRDFDKELMLHRDSDLQRVLPSLVASSDNASRAAATGDGYAFPSYTVRERCEPLKTWRGRRRAQSELLSLVEGLAQLLAALHASGRVHRDLKPACVLFAQPSMRWRLIDLGLVLDEGAPQSGWQADSLQLRRQR